jgi:hypothetical protein
MGEIMNQRALAFRIVFAVVSLGLSGCSDDGDSEPNGPTDEITLGDPSGTHEGHTYGEWGGMWWNWLYSNPASSNPALDTTGEFADGNQTEDVYFLAGTFGSAETRTFSIPADMPVFFPLITFQADNCGVPVDMQLPDADLQAYVDDNVANVSELTLEIDGATFASSPDEFSDYKVTATPMTYTVPADDSLYDLQGSDFEGLCDPSYTSGYFALVKGFPAGEHDLHFMAKNPGETPDMDFVIDVTDHITAE